MSQHPKHPNQPMDDDDQQDFDQSEDTRSKWQKIAEESGQDDDELEPILDENDLQESQAQKSTKHIDFPGREELENQLTAMEMKYEKAQADMARAQAELLNFRKRSEKDIENAHKYGNEKLLNALLPVADSLTRGLEGSEKYTDPQHANMREGLQLTLDLLNKTLEKFGVEVINPKKGDAFNPELHEAVTMQPDNSVKQNSVIQVLQPGYLLNGRVIRAAMVIVSV